MFRSEKQLAKTTDYHEKNELVNESGRNKIAEHQPSNKN